MSVLAIETAEVFAPLLQPARYKAGKGGRGSGKSRFFAGMLVEEQIAAPIDAVCLREVQKSLEFSVKREIECAIEAMNAGDYFDVQDRRILSRPAIGGAGVTIFEGMQNHTADSIKSLARFKRAWVEEAQNLSANSLELLRPTLREEDSELWFSWNPKNETDAVDVFFRNPPPGAIVVTANWADNPWFPQVLEDERQHDLRTASPEKYAHVWEGAYDKTGEARVFRNWRVEEFDTPAGVTHRLGADWGFSIDPSVMVRCHLVGRKLYIDYEAYKVGCEIDFLPDLFRSVPEAEKWPSTADSSRPETISYMQRHGFPRMFAAIKGPGSLEDGVQWLQSLEIIVNPRCRHTISELTHYAYKIDKQTGLVLPVLVDKKNHVIDALRYACEGVRRAAAATPVPVVTPLPSAMPMARHR